MNARTLPPVLEVQGVDIRYGGNLVVSGASFDVREGEFVTLLGPSGSGKTSLLRTIAGFMPASAGRISLRGEPMENVPAYQRDVGLVFQNYGLFPHMTVEGNLSFGPRMMKVPAAEIEARVAEALAQVRLERLRARYPHELSGGQQQRVAIARALAMRPSLLLLDEPMSNLDARLRSEMRVELAALLKRLGVTAVAVTHNQEEALGMSDRIVVMAEGGIRQVGTPSDIYLHPADSFVANFVGDANVVDAEHVGVAADGEALFRTSSGIVIRGGASAAHGKVASLLIRPELIEVDVSSGAVGSDSKTGLAAEVVSAAYMGSFIEIRAKVGSHRLLVKLPAGPNPPLLEAGQPVLMRWAPEAVKVLRT
ncbi:ABC transporter ATP-binding protein [Variovorax sp. Sphag1AA]|uniref:ABC transporter ATP-binding protein n=1 Tax=Variovorax sp. Sphag1AA TaxID=2587027 RepID=UPI0016231237|nr:ABC transporter ATP-binding protein [Variovorax sp. Sphag1AA]MBB3182424.1 ABC-type Fe3+/spermidine/putrescine transport system ATPase subunit [Variovorax sp. Sphag1AA]